MGYKNQYKLTSLKNKELLINLVRPNSSSSHYNEMQLPQYCLFRLTTFIITVACIVEAYTTGSGATISKLMYTFTFI